MISWVSRRRRWIVGAGAVGACAYVGYRLWERQQELRLIYREVSRVLSAPSRNRLRVHFDETNASCEEAIQSHLGTVRARLVALCDTDALQASVRGCADKKRKLDLWERLKVASIARTVTAVYALVLTHLLMRVLANLVARHLMLARAGADAVAAKVGAEAAAAGGGSGVGLPTTTQLRLLSAADHLVRGDGLAQLLAAVERAVRTRVKPIPLTRPLTTAEFQAILRGVRADVEGVEGGGSVLRGCLLPPPSPGAGPSSGLLEAILLSEVAEVVESAPFAVVLTQSLDLCFGELSMDLAERGRTAAAPCAEAPPAEEGAAVHVPLPSSPPAPLAKLIPRMSNCTAAVLATPRAQGAGAEDTNRYLAAAASAPSLNEFCFMVYAPQPGSPQHLDSSMSDCYAEVAGEEAAGDAYHHLGQEEDHYPLEDQGNGYEPRGAEARDSEARRSAERTDLGLASVLESIGLGAELHQDPGHKLSPGKATKH